MNKVLVYGDSNSWGYIPSKGLRYAKEQRWTGVAATILGSEYEIIEESISGRTTIYDDPHVPNRCGRDGLGYAISAGFPFDMVVLFLGTNDLKFTDAEGYRKGMEIIVDIVLNAQSLFCLEHPVFRDKNRVLLIGSPAINADIEKYRPSHALAGAAEESKKLSGIAKEIAAQKGVDFVDVSALVYPEVPDCMHLTLEDHRKLGIAIGEKIKSIFCEK